jgi:hypothetical protein
VWGYNTDLFDAATIQLWAELYRRLLERTAGDPEIRLSALLRDLAAAEEQSRAAGHQQFQDASLRKLKASKRKAITGV